MELEIYVILLEIYYCIHQYVPKTSKMQRRPPFFVDTIHRGIMRIAQIFDHNDIA